MPTPRLYDDLAHLWPLLSPPEHYAGEADTVRRVLERTLGAERLQAAPRPALLELGAGGGHTLVHLTDTFDAVAVDLSETMLANCRRLNPEVETVVGDMRDLRLGRTFDAVLVHDAIDYLVSEEELRATMTTVAAHLAPGGVALIAPTYLRETFIEDETEQDQHADAERVLTYFSYVHDPDPADATFELVLIYLIKEPAEHGELRVVEDRHTCGLFGEATWQRLMDEAGFDVEREETEAWSLFVGRKR